MKGEIFIQENQANKGIDFHISRGGVLVGVVFDPEGKPLCNADFRLVIQHEPRIGHVHESWTGAKLDGRGTFRHCGLAPGVIQVQICPLRFAPARAKNVEVPGSGEVKVEFRLSRGGTIKVSVTDEHGNPVSGVEFSLTYSDGISVSIGHQGDYLEAVDSHVTDTDGRITIERVPAGALTLTRSVKGKQGIGEPVSIAEGEVLQKRYVVKKEE